MTAKAVPPAILEHLRCITCRSTMKQEADALRCEEGHLFQKRRGWYDFSEPIAQDEPTRRTLQSFGYEWTSFGEITSEEEDFWWRRNMRDLPLERLEDTVGLDAGCGKGRFARLTAPHLRAMVALDGSDAVEMAAQNLGEIPNAVVMRSDVRAMPFDDGSFGLVMCLGVIHHLSDPKAGFDELARVLAPAGWLVLYIYSRPEGPGLRRAALRAASVVRHITVRLPYPVLRGLCVPLSAALYAGIVVPGRVGERRHISRLADLPLDTYRGQSWRSLWLDTFDRLSAPVEHRYIWPELEPWFDEAGLTVERVRDEAGFFILARRAAERDS